VVGHHGDTMGTPLRTSWGGGTSWGHPKRHFWGPVGVVGHHGDIPGALLGWWDIMAMPWGQLWGSPGVVGHHGNTPSATVGGWDILGTP